MNNENPNHLAALTPLPGPPVGRKYTQMCVAALRRYAQKMPTLSGVADHFHALDNELGMWETRAREMFATAEQLHAKVAQLDEQLITKDSQIEGLFEDFAQERDLWDTAQNQAQQQLSQFHEQLSQLTMDWTQANEQLAGYITLDQAQKTKIQDLTDQLSSLRGLYESIVRDLDSTQARLEAQLLSQSQIIQDLEDKFVFSQQQHANDFGASLDVIAQLRVDIVSSTKNIEALLDQKQVWEIQRAALTRHTGELEDTILNLVQNKQALEAELQTSYARHDEHANRLSQQLDQARQDSQQLHVQLGQANSQIQIHRQDLEVANAQLRDNAQEIIVLSQQINTTQECLARVEQAGASYQQSIVDLSSQLSQANTKSEELVARVSGLEKDLDEAMSWAAELEGLSNATAQELEQVRSQHQQALELLRTQSQEYTEQVQQQQQAHRQQLDELSGKHSNDLAQQQAHHEQDLAGQASEYELQLLTAAQELASSQHNYTKLYEMMEFGSSEHIRAFSELIDEHNDKLAQLTISQDQQLHDIEQTLDQLREHSAATQKQLDEANASKAALSVELFQSQQHALDVSQCLAEANNTIEELTGKLSQAQAQLALIPQLEQKLAQQQDLVHRQSQDLADLEVVVLSKAAQSFLYDESIPWDVRAWEGFQGQEHFVAVPGVKQWLDKNGLTLEDLTTVNFPGFTSADREHLAMCAGVRVEQFCQLPYVRPWLANKIQAQLKSGVSPIGRQGQWEVLADNEGNTSVRWRVNKLWLHLSKTTRCDISKDWSVYLLAHDVGMPEPVPPPDIVEA